MEPSFRRPRQPGRAWIAALVVAAACKSPHQAPAPPPPACDAPDGGSDAGPGPFLGAWPERADKVAVTPIFEEAITDGDGEARLREMVTTLGGSGPSAAVGFSASTFYCAELKQVCGAWHFDETRLRRILDLSQALDVPVVVHVNGGHWCAGGLHDPTSDFNRDWNVWRDDQVAWASVAGASPKPYLPTQLDALDYHYASYSRLFDEDDPRTYRHWKKQIVSEAAAFIVGYFAGGDKKPLLAGVSTDSEIQYADAPVALDYNPTFVEEWRQYLGDTGLYGPGGRYAGQGRTPPLSASDFNALFGTAATTLAQVMPPRQPDPSSPLWQEWNRFRVEALRHQVSDQRDWIVAAGVPAELVYGHEDVFVDPLWAADDPISTVMTGSGLGYTVYGYHANDVNLMMTVRSWGPRWGIFEVNPTDCGDSFDADLASDLGGLFTFRRLGGDILCPNPWVTEPTSGGCAKYGGLALAGTPYAQAIAKFVADPTPRPPSIDPFKLGTPRVRLVERGVPLLLNGATAMVAQASVVGASEPALVVTATAPSTAMAVYQQVALPKIDGARELLLRFDLGFPDDVAFGGGDVNLGVQVGSVPVASLSLGVADKWWHRWRPMMIDVSAFAGQTVDVALQVAAAAGGSERVAWGDPALYVAP